MFQTNFKKVTIRDKLYLAFIRSLPCIRSSSLCFGGIQAAHLRKGADGSTGKKPGDNYAFPCCAFHHAEQHRIGEVSFHKDMDKIHKLVSELWDNRGDWKLCVRLVLDHASYVRKRT